MTTNTPTPEAAALSGYLQAQGIKAGAWRDRVYLNDTPSACKAYLRATNYTPSAPLSGAELVVWMDRVDEQSWTQLDDDKARVIAALEQQLAPLGYTPTPRDPSKDTTPTQGSDTLARRLAERGIAAKAWRDRVYITGDFIPENANVYLLVDAAYNPTIGDLAGTEVKVWIDNATGDINEERNRIAADTYRACSDALNLTTIPTPAAVVAPPATPVQTPAPAAAPTSVALDDDIPF